MAGAEVRIFQALDHIPWVQGLAVVAVGGIWAPALTRESRLSLTDQLLGNTSGDIFRK